MASYKVYFVFECSPETHWGIKNEDEVKIYGEELYQDGEEALDSDGEDTTIKSWEDCVDDITSQWENDSLDEFDYINHEKNNPHYNGKSEFEDGTGDVNFETVKVEIYNDDKWKDLKKTLDL
tara:strand:- start:588 stop:953 length:366 start_codon:yes stop_codon:yes gene_type:complete